MRPRQCGHGKGSICTGLEKNAEVHSKGMVGTNWREIVCVGPRHMVENRGAEVAKWIWDRNRGLGLMSALRRQCVWTHAALWRTQLYTPVKEASCDPSGSWWVVSMLYLDTSHSLVYITETFHLLPEKLYKAQGLQLILVYMSFLFCNNAHHQTLL